MGCSFQLSAVSSQLLALKRGFFVVFRDRIAELQQTLKEKPHYPKENLVQAKG